MSSCCRNILLLALCLSLSACAQPITCPSRLENASYTGPYKGPDNNLSSADLARDITCANQFKQQKYPRGFVTIFGSSRLGEHSQLSSPAIAQAQDQLYAQVMALSQAWTRQHGKQYPILTGAGPGIMEAGSRGAQQGGGPSIGYTTYYDPPPRGNVEQAFWLYQGKQRLIDDGLVFSSVALRETMMILHSAAMIFAPGGTGTEWEIFQVLESMKSSELAPVPIFLVGQKELLWQSFYARLDDMVQRGMIKREEVATRFIHVEDATQVLPLLEQQLGLK